MMETQKTILLVEDEVLIAMSEQMTLEDYGYKVVTAESGEKAIEIADTNPAINLILMDINLSTRMLGTEAAEIILSKHDLPLIFLSSHIEKKVVEKTEGITSYGYIVKDSGETVMIASIKMAFRLNEAKLKEKEKDKALKRIEWMLNPQQKTKVSSELTFPPYGDLLALNTNRLILDSVGRETLASIVREFMDMLGTSSAVYERNGDYALGISSSGWCNYLDQASHRLCKTDNLNEALSCGKWLCHESCWKEASEPAMLRGETVDINCAGGIHLYAVPILAGDKIIGAINMGYGDPPRDPETLQNVAEKYNVAVEDLINKAEIYESRPPFIIELAKRRLESAASLIGEIVERKLATIEKAKIAQEWQNTFDSSNDAIWILDKEQKILRVNKTAERFFGKTVAEMVGKYCHEIVHHTKKPIPECPYLKTLQSGNREKMEMQVGDNFYQVIVDPIMDSENQLIGAVHLVTDITERKQMVNVLKQSEERFYRLFERAPLGYQSLDENGNFLEVNQAWLETLGYEKHEVLGKWFGDFLAPECKEAFEKRFPVFKREGKVHSEFIMFHKNGEQKIISFDGRVGNKSDGTFEKTHCILQDVTEQRMKDKALQESKAALSISELRYRRLFESAKDGILILDADTGMIVDANPYLMEMLGYSLDTFLGKKVWELGFFKDIVSNQANFTELQQKEYIRYDNKALEDRFGKRHEVEFISNVYLVNHHKVIQCNIRDITERKLSEKKLKEKQTHLDFILNATGTHFNVLDSDFNLIDVDSVWQEIYGKPNGRKCYDYFMGRKKPCSTCCVPKAFQTKNLVVSEEFLPKENKYFEVHTIPFQNEQGQWLCAEFNIDITERKKVALELVHEKDWNKNIINSAPDIIVGLGEKSKIIVFNKFAERLTGYKAEEVIGKEWIQIFVPKEIQQTIYDVWDNIVKNKLIDHHFENYIVTKSGELRLINWNNTIITENNEFEMILSIGEDITDRKKAEQELEKQYSLIKFPEKLQNSVVGMWI
jgi:PAS domain S-box-containing protein